MRRARSVPFALPQPHSEPEFLVLPPHLSRRILCACALMPASVCSAALNGVWDSMLLASLVLASSLNYWRHPTLGVRRVCDMVVTNVAICYQLFYSCRFAPRRGAMAYAAATLAAGVCYGSARFFGQVRGDQDTASRCHVGLHLIGNLGNLLLYDALGARLLGCW